MTPLLPSSGAGLTPPAPRFTITERAYALYARIAGDRPIRAWAEEHGCTTEQGLVDFCILHESEGDFDEMRALLWMLLIHEKILE